MTSLLNIAGNIPVSAAAAVAGQSLRFEDGDTAYLSFTPASAGNRKTWTFSCWVKRGNLGTAQYILGTPSADSFLAFVATNTLYFRFDSSGSRELITSAVYRDSGAWYHILISSDTTQATSSDRMSMYVNGVKITDFSTSTYPTLDMEGSVNNTVQHNIGVSGAVTGPFDGYLANVCFIDGTALDPTSFGEYDDTLWKPKSDTDITSLTFGTNGFYLNFEDSSAIGDDTSGNSNDWTANNLVATDVVPDSPVTGGNFATLNPLATDGATISEGNAKLVTPTTGYGVTAATFGVSSGKYYWEVNVVNVGTSLVGVVDDTFEIDGGAVGYLLGGGNKSIGYYYNGNKYIDGTGTSYGNSYTSGDIIGVALDFDNEEITFYKNGVSQGTISSTFINTMIPAVSDGSSSSATHIINFGQDSSFAGNETPQGNTDDNGVGDFYYAPPSGYLALTTGNLPAATITAPDEYFNTVLWSGDGASSRSITGVGFQPDFVWLKERSSTSFHQVLDAVRGAGIRLETNATDAETTPSPVGLSSFDTNGFTVENNNGYNQSGQTYVGWNWYTGATPSSNTDGSITSTVSANTTAGFSIVSYTGTGTTSDTVGHGLGVTPDMIIAKNRDTSTNNGHWVVYHKNLTANNQVSLNLNLAQAASSAYYGGGINTSPTTSVFSFANGSSNQGNVNESGDNYIAYCFAEVEGYSKFSSFEGNSDTTNFVYCGFRPAWVMIKCIDSARDWIVFDNKRNTYNVATQYLYPNQSYAEGSSSTIVVDFLSNGFNIKGGNNVINAYGQTLIFAAFAEAPFKSANAR